MKPIMLVCAIMLAFASGAFANTETERQCFAQTEACAVNANDGAFVLATTCSKPTRYNACVSRCDNQLNTCYNNAAGPNAQQGCNDMHNFCAERCWSRLCR